MTGEPDNTPLPGTVFTPRQVRMLKIAVIVMGILLVGGFALVLGAIVYQASQLGKGGEGPPPAEPMAVTETDLAIPDGATVAAVDLDGNRLALHLKSGAGPEIVVVDLKTGKILSRIKLKPQ